MSDEAGRDAGSAVWQAQGADTRLSKDIEDFVTTNGLIMRNVVGAMNSDFAYYRGLFSIDPDALFDEERLLSDIWDEREAIEERTQDWIYGYSILAYGGLPAEDMSDYIAFSKSPLGRDLNNALFAAYDKLFESQSYRLGAITGALMERFAGPTL